MCQSTTGSSIGVEASSLLCSHFGYMRLLIHKLYEGEKHQDFMDFIFENLPDLPEIFLTSVWTHTHRIKTFHLHRLSWKGSGTPQTHLHFGNSASFVRNLLSISAI